MKIIAMNCPNCGANLQVAPEMESFSCGSCGTSLSVLRQGGTVFIKDISNIISKIQSGTDRTAAELALVRLKDELVHNRNEIGKVSQPRPIEFFGFLELSKLMQGFAVGFVGSFWGGPAFFIFVLLASLIWALYMRSQRIQIDKLFNSFCKEEVRRLNTEYSLIDDKIKATYQQTGHL